MNLDFTKPIFFKKNRVFRVYTGGWLMDRFCGSEGKDDFFPEEWIASSTKANNVGHTDPFEGISFIEGTDIPFSEAIEAHKAALLGDRDDMGVLVKFLDSEIRLPMQVHPTREFSKAHFGSPYGKAESWLILATRENACIYFGFKDRISFEELKQAVAENKDNPDSFLRHVNRVPVQPGDVFFVPAGMIHAIGAGCLILETQEPTDFTIQPEYHCGSYEISNEEMYIGLSEDDALSCFNLDYFGEAAIQKGRVTPTVVRDADGVKEEIIIGDAETECFSATRYTLSGGEITLERTASVWIVVDGEGTLLSDGYERKVKTGDYFFLPYEAKSVRLKGNVTAVSCKGGI